MKSVRKLSRKVMGEKRLKSDDLGDDEVFPPDFQAEVESRSAPAQLDPSAFPFKMPSAIPGVGDCHICCEVVPSVKVLPCGHCLCAVCATKMSGGGRRPLSCAECRQTTDVSGGVQSLPTKYFGSVKCDICLSQKDTDDMWWCNQCAQAICSKCSIKDHSSKSHAISEWNRLDPVLYSLKYINGMRLTRQQSYVEVNQALIKRFMEEVEELLHQRLMYPRDLEEIRSSLVNHYGSNITSVDYNVNNSETTGSQRKESTDRNFSSDSGPKVIAKVLQVAGVNIEENLIPSISDRSYQVQFNKSVAEVADFLISSVIRFDPVGHEEFDLTQLSPNSPTSDLPGMSSGGTIEMSEETTFPRPKMHIPVMEAGVSDSGLVALRSEREVFLCQPANNKHTAVAAPPDKVFAGINMNPKTKELLVILHSTTRRHEWSLESWNVSQLPHSVNFTVQLDIDPEDRVLGISVTSSRNSALMYEIRNCERFVSEIWRVQMVERRSHKGPKAKEALLHQKSGAQYMGPLCAFDEAKGTTFVVWDKLCRTLLKMTVRNGRCEQILKILTAPTDSIPFCLDSNGFLWIFDNDQRELRATKAPIAYRSPTHFTGVAKYDNCPLQNLVSLQSGKIQGISLTGQSVTVVSFSKV